MALSGRGFAHVVFAITFVGKMAERSKACDSSGWGYDPLVCLICQVSHHVIVAWVRIPLLSRFLGI